MPTHAEHGDLGGAITKLMSLHDGDLGVVDVVACGQAAVPALRSILFSREPSGLYESRRRAVEALRGLRAFNALREFLASPRTIADPIEKTGEEAVINAAARVIGEVGDSRDIPMLFSLIKTHLLAGAIEALGRFRQITALPYFIGALGDDFIRMAAESAIEKLGAKALNSLIIAATEPQLQTSRETNASISRRRSALKLLQTISMPTAVLNGSIFSLVREQDPWIAFWSARLCLAHVSEDKRGQIVERLFDLLKSADEVLAEEIEDCFVDQYRTVRHAIDAAEARTSHSNLAMPWRSNDHTRKVLARVKNRTASYEEC